MLLVAVLATAYVGFALLALSQPKHWRKTVRAPLPGRRRLRLLRASGGLLIAGSLALALLRDGPSFGALLWATAISLAALGAAFTLAGCPCWLRPRARLAAPGRAREHSRKPPTTPILTSKGAQREFRIAVRFRKSIQRLF